MNNSNNYSKPQFVFLILLRVLIGWYFLYEGLSKFLTPNWTSFAYLKDSQGLFSSLFLQISENPVILNIVDYINIYGLTLIGLSLIVGAFVKWGSIGGISFLALYYLSHPPIIDAHYLLRIDDSALWVDKNLIMLCALFIVFYFPTSKLIGLDRYIFKNKRTVNK